MIIKRKSMKRINLLFLFIYIFTVYWFTVFNRALNYSPPRLELFWSYRKWLSGDWATGLQILENIAMFAPFGYLLTSILSERKKENDGLRKFHGGAMAAVVFALAVVFTLSIESLQLLLNRGLFEWDDCVSNVTGAVVGYVVYCVFRKWMTQRVFYIVNRIIYSVFIVVCGAVIIMCVNSREYLADNHSLSSYCFQIEKVSYDSPGSELEIGGFAFLYEREKTPFSLYLKSTDTGKEVKMKVTDGIDREDVNDYFDCEYDYRKVGFTATVGNADESHTAGDGRIDPSKEYEVMIQWPWSGKLSSGVYITGTDVHYVPLSERREPEREGELGKIVEKGTLLICRPDCHCWVYQLKNDLYWIADSEFDFDEDGETVIEFEQWSTQPRKSRNQKFADSDLKEDRRGSFEDYELEGDFGSYRVMKRKLPTSRSVTTIITGRLRHGGWIWKNYIRPVYGELKKSAIT